METINILFVDDEVSILRALERFLRKMPYAWHFADSGAKALDIMAATPIHVLVTDMRMPGMDGLSLLRVVKEMYPDTIRLVLSAYFMPGQLLPCINTGEIFRFIMKPIAPQELQQAIQDAISRYLVRRDRDLLINELQQKNKDLQLLALTDELTGLPNRRSLILSLEQLFNQCVRYPMNLTCFLLDLDHFKQVNDIHGHDFGDVVLKGFAHLLKNSLRAADLAFRIGGEEFVALLPHTRLEDATSTGNRILEACRANHFQNGRQKIAVTVSIGAACFKRHQPRTATEMLKIADKMLYQAKSSGRDRLC